MDCCDVTITTKDLGYFMMSRKHLFYTHYLYSMKTIENEGFFLRKRYLCAPQVLSEDCRLQTKNVFNFSFSNQLIFLVFSAVIGAAYIMIWVVSLKGLLSPGHGRTYYHSAEDIDNEKVSGLKGSQPMQQRRVSRRPTTSFQRAQKIKAQRITRKTANVA